MLSQYFLWTALAVVPSLLLAAIGARIYLSGGLREYPFFFAYAVLQALRAVIELVLRRGSYGPYFTFYWSAEAVIVLLNFAVLYEVCRNLLQPYLPLRPQLQAWFRYAAVALLATAVLLSAFEPAGNGWWILAKVLLVEKVARFAQAGLLVLIFALAAFFHLQWKQLSFGIALGFGIYASVCLAAVAVREHFGPAQDFTFALTNSLAYNCACLIWLAYAFQRETAPVTAKIAPQRADFKLAEWNRALGGLLRR